MSGYGLGEHPGVPHVSEVVYEGGPNDPRSLSSNPIIDPSVVGLARPEGSIYHYNAAGDGRAYLKTGVANTAWTQLTGGGGGLANGANTIVAGTPVDFQTTGFGEATPPTDNDIGFMLSNATTPASGASELAGQILWRSKRHDTGATQVSDVALRPYVEGNVGSAIVGLQTWITHPDFNSGNPGQLMRWQWGEPGADNCHLAYALGGVVRVGSGTPSHVGTVSDPTVFANVMECNSTFYQDGACTQAGVVTNTVAGIGQRYANNGEVQFGANLNGIKYNTDQTNDHMCFGTGGGGVNGLFLFMDRDRFGTDYGIASFAYPVVGVHDNSATGANWGGFFHNGTDVETVNGVGGWVFAGNIGFYGTAAVAQPTITGSRGGNTALASLLTELATQGLIIDSSS